MRPGRNVGARVGERFYDITFKSADGKTTSISDLRGKVVFVHFWGPWCSPCMREFPELRHFYQQLEKQMPGQVALVLLQVRESYDASQRWLAKNDFEDVPIADSGVTCAEQTTLTLADGGNIEDRLIARAFPTTYVLDKNGMVIFSHQGPVSDWRDYVPFSNTPCSTPESSRAFAIRLVRLSRTRYKRWVGLPSRLTRFFSSQ